MLTWQLYGITDNIQGLWIGRKKAMSFSSIQDSSLDKVISFFVLTIFGE